ncbi:hypothetical protein [Aurantiacibacter gilvus]|uniref:Uncharacterized protein n=1 Tax=Aurantiacibacter gilvus TaxID=3139141 RepID=A0ABU9IF07_9SPHN
MRSIATVSAVLCLLSAAVPAVAGAQAPALLPALQVGAGSGQVLQDFIMDSQRLGVRIDTTTVTPADDERVDREVQAYRDLADRVMGDGYDALPDAQKQAMLMGLRMHYQGAVQSVPQLIEQARSLVTGVGRGDAAYNFLLAYDVYLYAATHLFPQDGSFAVARSQVQAAMAELGGSRAGALAAEDAAELAAARNVRMPSAITTDPAAIAMFRQAWTTSGIDWQIMRINVTSGWRDKIENGRVVGQRRDAAIAARDPSNPDYCNLYDFTLVRDRSGSVRRDSHSTTRIACENVAG